MTSTLSRTSSAARSAARSLRSSAHRYSTTIFCPSTLPELAKSLAEGRVMLHTRWSAEAWPQVKAEFRKAFAQRSQIRRAGWFN